MTTPINPQENEMAVSPSIPNGLKDLRSEAEVRAARAARAEASLADLRRKMEEAGEHPALINEIDSSMRSAFAVGDMMDALFRQVLK